MLNLQVGHSKLNKKRVILFGILLAFAQAFVGQTHVSIWGDDMMSHPLKRGYVMITGHVNITLKGMHITCSYAEQRGRTDDFFARGNVVITMKDKSRITGTELVNYPDKGYMIVDKNVIYTSKDKKTQLATDRMYYDHKRDFSYYLTGGVMTSDSTNMVSKKGYFYQNDVSAFRGEVFVDSPKYSITTDTLEMHGDSVYFFEATEVLSDSNYIYCEAGWYDTKSEYANLFNNAYIASKEQQMWGDSIFYNLKDNNGEAFGNVKVIDTMQDIIVYSQYAFNNKHNGYALFTDKVLSIIIDEDKDSLFLNSDTLRLEYDNNENIKSIYGYYKVKFFRDDMQGVCDSLAYLMQDSTMRMYYNPILWSNQDQLTGDSITMFLSNNKPDSMNMEANAFIVSQSYDTLNFNQIKGNKLTGFFNANSKLERVEIYSNIETIYYVVDDIDSTLVGILKVKAEDMTINFLNQKIHTVNYWHPEAGSMYPEKDLPENERTLLGYAWHNALRPKNKTELITNKITKNEQEK